MMEWSSDERSLIKQLGALLETEKVQKVDLRKTQLAIDIATEKLRQYGCEVTRNYNAGLCFVSKTERIEETLGG